MIYFVSNFSVQPEYVGPVPEPLASSYLGDGYTTQPFSRSGFYYSESPVSQSLIKTLLQVHDPLTLLQHQPVPPEQRSTYSELAPNLNFMNSQSRPPPASVAKDPATQDGGSVSAKGTISSPDIEKNPFALGFDGPPLTAFGRKVPLKVPRPSKHKLG